MSVQISEALAIRLWSALWLCCTAGGSISALILTQYPADQHPVAKAAALVFAILGLVASAAQAQSKPLIHEKEVKWMGLKSFFKKLFKSAASVETYLDLAAQEVKAARSAGFIDNDNFLRLDLALGESKGLLRALDTAREAFGDKSVTVRDRARVLLGVLEGLQERGATHIKSERARAEFLRFVSLAHAAVAVLTAPAG